MKSTRILILIWSLMTIAVFVLQFFKMTTFEVYFNFIYKSINVFLVICYAVEYKLEKNAQYVEFVPENNVEDKEEVEG